MQLYIQLSEHRLGGQKRKRKKEKKLSNSTTHFTVAHMA